MEFRFHELIDLQNSVTLKKHYEKLSMMATGQDLMDFKKAATITAFLELQLLSTKFMSHFGTMYRCKQAFSVIKFVKLNYQTRLTYAVCTSKNINEIGSHQQPRLEDLGKKVQPQGSHGNV